MKPNKLSNHLEYFFTVRLIKQKGVSLHTITSYSKTFQLLFEFASKQLKKAPSQLMLQDLNAHFVSQFLDDLENRRKICPRTRNRFFGRIGGRILSESLSLSIEQLGV